MVPIVSRAKAITTTYSATKYFGVVHAGTPAHETTPMRTRRARPRARVRTREGKINIGRLWA